jgi:hypothetical protein
LYFFTSFVLSLRGDIHLHVFLPGTPFRAPAGRHIFDADIVGKLDVMWTSPNIRLRTDCVAKVVLHW